MLQVRMGAAAAVLGAVMGTTGLSGAGATEPAQAAQAAETLDFTIPPQSLETAVMAFGRQSGWQVAVDHATLAGRSSPGVSGRLAAGDALRRVLAGTGVTWRVSEPGTVVLERLDGAGALVLDPVTVEGAGRPAETATGPVQGYIARRSIGGTKTDAPLTRVPQSVSVVTRDQMEAQGIQKVEQALRYTPGIKVETFGPENRGDTMFLRGFENDTHLNGLLLQPGTGYSGWTIEPYGLERVEVLRGPVSVLYGKASPGGVVNQISKRPTAEPVREVQAGYGSFGRLQGAFDVGGTANGDDSVLFRLTGVARDGGTQVDHTDDDRLFLAPAMTLAPDEDTTVTVLAQVQRDRTGNTVGFLPADGTVFANPNGQIPTDRFVGEPDFDRYDTDQVMVGYEAEHTVNDALTLRQNARWGRLDLSYRTVYGSGLQADRRTLNRSSLANEDSTDMVLVDTQALLSGTLGGLGHEVLVGLDHQSAWADTRTGFGAAPPIDVFAPVYGMPVPMPAFTESTAQSLRQTGLYVQDSVSIGERWTVVLGGRHDWAAMENENRILGTTATKDDTAFTGRAGVVYETAFGLAPYVSYAESFSPTAITGAAGQVLDPETARQVEAGIKYQPPGGDSYLTAAVFDLRRENVITFDAVTWTATQTGQTRSRGLELEGKLVPFEGFNLLGSYTYQDVKILKSTAPDLGKRPMTLPKHMASLWGDYAVPHGPLAGIDVGLGVRYTGESYGDQANTFTVDGHTVFDAEIGYEFDGYRLAVNASNLLDKEYVTSCWGSCYYGPRRTVLASLRYRW